MFKKAGSYEKARKMFAVMTERGIRQSTVTYNSLMSFENNYKEVSKMYNQVNLVKNLIYYSYIWVEHAFEFLDCKVASFLICCFLHHWLDWIAII